MTQVANQRNLLISGEIIDSHCVINGGDWLKLVVTLSAVYLDRQGTPSKEGGLIMAISNVKSSEYRAAGGRKWHQVKGGQNGIKWDGPKTETALEEENQAGARQDEYLQTKADIRKSLAQGYDESLVTVVPEGQRKRKPKLSKWQRKMRAKKG